MKEHAQEYGVRRWAGDDLVELQSEPLEAIQKLVEPYAPCIIQGCEVNATEKRIELGMVALWEVDEENRKKGVKIACFEGYITPHSGIGTDMIRVRLLLSYRQINPLSHTLFSLY